MNIIVIGAGFGGLAAASLLAKQGHSVTVLEKNKLPGGRANVFEAKGFRYDMGPSWYLMPDIFENFFKEFNTTPQKEMKLYKLDPSYTMYFDNERMDIHEDINKNFKMFESIEKGSSKKIKEYLAQAKKQYDIAIKHFIYKKYITVFDLLDVNLIKHVKEVNVNDNLHEYVQKYVSHDKLQKMLEYSMVFLGGAPKNTPSLYSIMSHVDLTMGVYYPEGGMHTVATAMESLAKKQGVTFKYTEPVEKIVVENKKVVGVQTKKKIYEADIVIANADYPHVEMSLLEKEDQTYNEPYWEKRTIAPSAFIMYLGIDKKVPGLTHHNLFLADDWMKHFGEIFDTPKWPKDPSYYVCAPSVTDPTVAPSGKENLFVLVPVAAGLKDTPAIRKKYEEFVLTDLEKKLKTKIKEHIIFKKAFAHKDFTELYNAYKGTALGLTHTLRQTALLRPKQKSKKVKNLYYVGQFTHPGVGVPMVIISAQIVADMIQNDK